jgi:hypothetical protein
VKKIGYIPLSLVDQLAVAATRGPFIAKLPYAHFGDEFTMISSWILIGAIKNEFSKVFDPRSGTEDHFEIVTVAAVPSGFCRI